MASNASFSDSFVLFVLFVSFVVVTCAQTRLLVWTQLAILMWPYTTWWLNRYGNDRGEQIGAPELARGSVFQPVSFVHGFRLGNVLPRWAANPVTSNVIRMDADAIAQPFGYTQDWFCLDVVGASRVRPLMLALGQR